MSKADKIERSWRRGAINDVRLPDMLHVLEANRFEVRRDRGNHILAEHEGLAEHPAFGFPGCTRGRVGINVHYRGRSDRVHPRAVRDVLEALDWIRNVRKRWE
jgi:hypothetical protein